MIRSIHRQRGAGMLGFLFMFMLIGFFSLLVLKVGPVYLEHFKVSSSLESLKKDVKLGEKSKDEILELLQKRWNINSVTDVSIQDVVFKKDAQRLKIQVTYEVVRPIAFNISVLVNFDDSIEASVP